MSVSSSSTAHHQYQAGKTSARNAEAQRHWREDEVVGYGLTGPEESFDGLRRIGSSTLGVAGQELGELQPRPGQAVLGDSGGPTFYGQNRCHRFRQRRRLRVG